MLLANRLRESFASYPYFETLLILAIYFGLGYWNDPEDLCMVKSPLLPMTIMLAVITLFHGISSGLFAISVIGIAMKFTYTEFDYEYFLGQLVLVLLFGEFHYAWQRKISQFQTEARFTKQKLEELGNAFYALKISHDQIEKSYIVKPMSIRNSIRMIREELYNGDRSRFFPRYLLMLEKSFVVKKAVLVKVEEDDSIRQLAASEDTKPLLMEDPIVQDVLEKKMPAYISSESHEKSRYLAVIPAIINDRIIGLLAIEEMPFVAFNKDALVSIMILTNYMFAEKHKGMVLDKIDTFLPKFENDFRFETYRLALMYREYAIESTLLTVRSEERLIIHQLIDMLEENLRTLDMMGHLVVEGREVVAVLFPFSDRSSVEGFFQRVGEQLERLLHDEKVTVGYFPLSQMDLVHTFIYGEA